MLGFDNINFRVDASALSSDALNHLSGLLPREGYNSITDARWQAGSVNNLIVCLNELGLVVKGSLAEFYFGNNTLTVPRNEVGNALDKLSDTLHVDMTKAEVSKIEFSSSFQMKNQVGAYLNILGNLTHFARVNTTKNTLTYTRGEAQKQVLCFYDKLRELRAKRQYSSTPKPFADAGNILRYEVRLLKNIPQQLKQERVTGGMLADKDLFRQLAKFWGNSYFCIQKTYTDIDMNKVKTPNDARDCLLAHLLNEAGAGMLEKYFTDLKARGVFDNRQYYTRFKRQIKDTVKKYSDTESESLATELDNDVRTELSYI